MTVRPTIVRRITGRRAGVRLRGIDRPTGDRVRVRPMPAGRRTVDARPMPAGRRMEDGLPTPDAHRTGAGPRMRDARTGGARPTQGVRAGTVRPTPGGPIAGPGRNGPDDALRNRAAFRRARTGRDGARTAVRAAVRKPSGHPTEGAAGASGDVHRLNTRGVS